MPTSQPRLLTPVHTLIKNLNPSSIIDIGIGHGKTGVLLREFLDIMDLRYRKTDWKTKIYGIEIFKEYYNPLWDYAYDRVTIGDALININGFPPTDIILALDVWEHFTRSYAKELLSICLNKSKYVLICTPRNPSDQKDVYNNEAESHISKWTPKDFNNIPFKLITCTPEDWIILLSLNYEIPYKVYKLFTPISSIRKTIKIVFNSWKASHFE